jgi:RNA polymerase sigma factor (sigma-70 family)
MFDTDADIVSRLKEGDGDALAALVEKYYKSLYQFGQHFTRDRDIVTDCLQDVFLNLWQNREHVPPIHFLRQYLLTALKRRIIRVGSQTRRQAGIEGEASRDYNFSLEFSVEDLIVEKQLEEEKAARLRLILNQLPDRQKEAIYLVYYQQLDHSQVAEIMNINRQSVYNLLSISIRKIREFWQDAAPALLLLLLH